MSYHRNFFHDEFFDDAFFGVPHYYGTGFFGGDFFGGGFFYPQSSTVVDTHDGERRKRADKARDERIRRFRRDREHLRETILRAIEGPPEIAAVVQPFVSDARDIDFGALLVAAKTLRALADWHEQALRAAQDDEDDTEMLLLT